jgi:hypothetical protein
MGGGTYMGRTGRRELRPAVIRMYSEKIDKLTKKKKKDISSWCTFHLH